MASRKDNASGQAGVRVAGGQAEATKEKKLVHCKSNHTASTASGTAVKVLKSRSTSTEDQRARVLELLKAQPQTTYSLRKRGIAQCAARIWELRKQGYPISTSTVTAIDSDGYAHVGAALYTLEKPAQQNFGLEDA